MTKAWLGIALAAAAAWFAFRGPWRGLERATDFAVVFAGAKVWAAGGNPYDPATLNAAWADAGGPTSFLPGGRTAVYPPSAFVAVAPWAGFSWLHAKILWLGLGVASYLGMAALALRSLNGPARGWLLAGILAFAPAHTAISLGQPSLPAFGLMAAAAAPAVWRWPSGLALGLACALKPQLGGVFVLYALCRRRWACVLTAGTVATALLAIGAVRLELAGVPWRHDLARNLAVLAEHEGGVGVGNKLRHDLIHLAVPLHALGLPERSAGILGAALAGGMFLWAFARRPHDSARADGDLAALALLAALLPLPVYHRIYDATPLIFAAAWAVAERRWALLLLLAPLLAPGAAWLEQHAPAAAYSLGWRFWSVHPAWLVALFAGLVFRAISLGKTSPPR